MRKVSWIVRGNSHYAVIVLPKGYINLVATNSSFFAQLVGEGDDAVYSSSAKNLRAAKRLSVAFGYSLFENSPAFQNSEQNSNESVVRV